MGTAPVAAWCWGGLARQGTSSAGEHRRTEQKEEGFLDAERGLCKNTETWESGPAVLGGVVGWCLRAHPLQDSKEPRRRMVRYVLC